MAQEAIRVTPTAKKVYATATGPIELEMDDPLALALEGLAAVDEWLEKARETAQRISRIRF